MPKGSNGFQKGYVPWSKGLTKETDRRLEQMSESKKGVPVPKKIVDLRGQRFGRLQAIEPMGRDKTKNVIWLCECDCGSFTTVASRALIHNGQRSCGCLRSEKAGRGKRSRKIRIDKKNNKEYGKEYHRQYVKIRRSEPKERINHTVSGAIYKALKERKNGHHWESLVGYTLLELMSHLEKQFKPGMSWGNYGNSGWHIDHKIPQSVFNYTSPEHIDFERCWALENLQPLWEKENLVKHTKIKELFQPCLAL